MLQFISKQTLVELSQFRKQIDLVSLELMSASKGHQLDSLTVGSIAKIVLLKNEFVLGFVAGRIVSKRLLSAVNENDEIVDQRLLKSQLLLDEKQVHNLVRLNELHLRLKRRLVI